MPLTTCPDCGRHISPTAVACPQCGRPMRAQEIERTAKEFKRAQIHGAGMFFGGLLLFAGTALTEGPELFSVIGLISAFGGAAYFIQSLIQAWWHHG